MACKNPADTAQPKVQAKATQRQRLTRLTAPIDGTVQQLAIHSAGGVVTQTQALMIVVPESVTVAAKVSIANQDIGFLNAGQKVEVKIETFPYTKYGTIVATVDLVSSDALMDGKGGTDGKTALSAVYPATLNLGKRSVNISGKPMRLSPGMNVTAEIKTWKRRVIEYLLSPI